jgi:hypothetical protein
MTQEDPMTEDAPIEIHAPGVDTAELVEQLRQSIAEKMRKGLYCDPRVAHAERLNLRKLSADTDFLAFYLDCLRDAVTVDINDFAITEQRRTFTSFWITLKKAIWNLLKFYTYRLWSQQNQINSLLLSAVESLDMQYRSRLDALEARLGKPESSPAQVSSGKPAG